jgi:hypothetical protein
MPFHHLLKDSSIYRILSPQVLDYHLWGLTPEKLEWVQAVENYTYRKN